MHCYFFRLVSTACAPEAKNDSSLKVIIGENDLSFYRQNNYISNSIGKMALGCTATHIGDGLVLTAGHCLADDHCNAKKYDITWDYRINNKKSNKKSKCLEIVETADHIYADYAILKYSNPPHYSLPISREREIQLGEKLIIFSYPEGRVLSKLDWCENTVF